MRRRLGDARGDCQALPDAGPGLDVIETSREYLGWVLHETGPGDADHRVLLLPGALATSAFYEDLLAEPSIRESGISFIATTVPGFGGTAAPADLSMESYSSSASRLAADLWCDVVVGHSLGANVALEMVSAGEFSGPVVLLSPSFSRKDESIFPRALDSLSRVFGHLPYALMMKLIGPARGAAARGSTSVPCERVEEERSALPPRSDPLLPCVSRPAMARSPGDSAIQASEPGLCSVRRTTSASHPLSANCSRRLRT